MATILPFVIRSRTLGKLRSGAGEAAIIIFPGVRYEPAPKAGPTTPRSTNGGGVRPCESKSNG